MATEIKSINDILGVAGATGPEGIPGATGPTGEVQTKVVCCCFCAKERPAWCHMDKEEIVAGAS